MIVTTLSCVMQTDFTCLRPGSGGPIYARARVRAALRAAWLRSFEPLVRTACAAERRRAAAPRFWAVARPCLESDLRDAAALPSRFRTALTARERVSDGLRREWLCPLR